MKIVFIIICSITLLIGCNSATSNKESSADTIVKTAFYYYPKRNIYFDTTNKQFIFYDSTSNKWNTGNLPAELYADLGKSSTIENPTQPVWLDNKNHRLIYSAALYADSTDFKKKAPVKKTKNTAVKDGPAEPKKKTKVGEFLKKIFGKKKKEENR
jgi:hypothetical protein